MEVVSRDAVYTVNAFHEYASLWAFTLSNCSASRELVRGDAARPLLKTHRKRALIGGEARESAGNHSGSRGKYLNHAPRPVGSRSDNGLRGDHRAHGAPRGTASARGARGKGLRARGSEKNHRNAARSVGRHGVPTSGKLKTCPAS